MLLTAWTAAAGQIDPLRRITSAAMMPTTSAVVMAMLMPWKRAKTTGLDRTPESKDT